jgi:flagellar basal-body rod protein FlgG
MIKALSTSATGMRAQQQLVDVVANNLANVNTTGFKRSRLDFQDLLYDTQIAPGTQVAVGLEIPTGLQVGSGARTISTTKVFTQGVPEETQRDLDVAVNGQGFFEITLPDGTKAYTRDGAFRKDSAGNLTTAEGLLVSPAITIPENIVGLSIGRDGTITAALPDGTVSNAGQLTLATFPNPSGLSSLGGNLYLPTAASGNATTNLTPGRNGTGELQQGFLERSNVDVVVELVKLITAQRAYEVNSRAIRSSDDMLAAANNMTR